SGAVLSWCMVSLRMTDWATKTCQRSPKPAVYFRPGRIGASLFIRRRCDCRFPQSSSLPIECESTLRWIFMRGCGEGDGSRSHGYGGVFRGPASPGALSATAGMEG